MIKRCPAPYVSPGQILSSRYQNQVREAARANTIFAGVNIRAVQSLHGTVMSRDLENDEWRHPWHTQVRWDGQAFVAQVNPGFVNGNAPYASDYRGGAAVPLTGDPEERYKLPEMRLAWRKVGGDADELDGFDEPIPEFFKFQGVEERRPSKLQAIFEGGSYNIPTEYPTERYLRASEVVLRQPRQSLWWEVEALSPLISSASVKWTPIIKAPPSKDSKVLVLPRIMNIEDLPPEVRLLRALKDGALDNGFDQEMIATVYALSPPKKGKGQPPNQDWKIYVQHHLFWNMMHWTHVNVEPVSNNITLAVPLAFGMAQPLINGLLAPVNDFFSEALAFASNNTVESGFWSI
jgi:hypothetical protein